MNWKRFTKWFFISLAAIAVLGFTALSFMAGSPKDAVSMLRYALPHMHRGNIHDGDLAPDARLLDLDGATYFHLRDRRQAGRPLMITFGSYT